MHRRIARLLGITQLIAFAITSVLGGTLYHVLQSFEEAGQLAEHAHEKLDEIERSRTDILESGMWLHSYVINPMPAFLERARQSAVDAKAAAQYLEALLGTEGPQGPMIRAWTAQLGAVAGGYQEMAESARHGSTAQLQSRLAADLETDSTYRLLAALDTLEQGQKRSLRTGLRAEARHLGSLKQVLVLSGIVIAALMVWAARYSAQLLLVNARAINQLKTNALQDPLTGVLNRRGLDSELQALADTQQTGRDSVAVLALDLDDFKPVNDAYSHAAGDEVLKETARRLSQECRGADAVARVGGDEFVVLLHAVPAPSDAYAIAQRIQARLTRPIELGRMQVRVGASIGIALLPRDGADIQTVMRMADQRMYLAKKAGKSRIHAGDTASG